jgi:hypothetical protein
MSWEEVSRRRYPCPCGKGEYEEIDSENDWFQHQTSREMLCSDCKEQYAYDSRAVAGHPGDEIERGWVLRCVLEAEDIYQKSVMALVRERYYKQWCERFANAHTKKRTWEILTVSGKYYPSLGTFYQHTKGYDRQRLKEYVDRIFGYVHDLEQILDVCGGKPKWGTLGVTTGDTCELCQAKMQQGTRQGTKEWICTQCRYRRPFLPGEDLG